VKKNSHYLPEGEEIPSEGHFSTPTGDIATLRFLFVFLWDFERYRDLDEAAARRTLRVLHGGWRGVACA
jgi:hypothetical protein